MSKRSKKQAILWFIVVIVCVVITYYYQKSKAAEEYQKMLEVAAKNCNLDTLKLLIKKSRGDSSVSERALHYASGAGCLEVVKFLIEKGADINTAKYEKWTALHSAAYRGNLEIIRFLLEKDANPKIRDKDGKNPRDVAVIESRHNKDKPYREIIKLLANAEEQHKSK